MISWQIILTTWLWMLPGQLLSLSQRQHHLLDDKGTAVMKRNDNSPSIPTSSQCRLCHSIFYINWPLYSLHLLLSKLELHCNVTFRWKHVVKISYQLQNVWAPGTNELPWGDLRPRRLNQTLSLQVTPPSPSSDSATKYWLMSRNPHMAPSAYAWMHPDYHSPPLDKLKVCKSDNWGCKMAFAIVHLMDRE